MNTPTSPAAVFAMAPPPPPSLTDSSDDVKGVDGWTANLTLGSDSDHAQCVVVELVSNKEGTACPPAPTDAKCCQFMMDGSDHYFTMPVGACNFLGGTPIGSDDRCTQQPKEEGGSDCVIS